MVHLLALTQLVGGSGGVGVEISSGTECGKEKILVWKKGNNFIGLEEERVISWECSVFGLFPDIWNWSNFSPFSIPHL